MNHFLKSAVLLMAGGTLLTLSACSSVQSHAVGEETFYLTEYYNEPVTGFESWSLSRKAEELCPKGHHNILRKAGKPSEFAKQHFECLGDKNCEYALEWRIRCTERPEETFSIFGKS